MITIIIYKKLIEINVFKVLILYNGYADLISIKLLIFFFVSNLLITIQIHIIHTYIIGHYNTSVRIIDLVSHTTYVVCVNFIHKWGDLQLKLTPNDRFFEKLFMAIFIYSQSFCQKSAEKKSPKKYFSYFILMSDLGIEPWLFV